MAARSDGQSDSPTRRPAHRALQHTFQQTSRGDLFDMSQWRKVEQALDQLRVRGFECGSSLNSDAASSATSLEQPGTTNRAHQLAARIRS